MPPPPQSYLDYDGVHFIEQEWYLEIIDSFTDEDLYSYFCKKFNLSPRHPDDIKQFKKTLAYMAERHGLDLVLFTIDYASDMVHLCNAEAPRLPFDIQKYIPEVSERYKEKKARDKLEGIDFVVSRK